MSKMGLEEAQTLAATHKLKPSSDEGDVSMIGLEEQGQTITH